MISGFRKTKFHENPLRIVGGDSKQRNLFSNTSTTQYTHTMSGIYILIIFLKFWTDFLLQNVLNPIRIS